jgi:ADP-ribosyl-[dinitrogen reductase] hydrolase
MAAVAWDDEQRWKAYRDTLFEARTPRGTIRIRIDARTPALDALLAERRAQSWCFITASNPRSEVLGTELNRARNEELRRALDALALPARFDGDGRSQDGTWTEASVLALGVGRELAVGLGRDFGQNAVVWGRSGGAAELLDCREDAGASLSAGASRAQGALLGLAIGDCLGTPVEGWRPERIAAEHGVLRDFGFRGAPIWSDDTQQALVLVESMLEAGRPDPQRVGRRFVAMRDVYPSRSFGAHRGTGSGFRSAVDAFAEHGDWRRSGNPARAGNGAAMRIAPIGAALASASDDELAHVVFELSALTHREGRALAGALAVACTAARLARRESGFPIAAAEARALLADLAAWTRAREQWMRGAEIAVAVADEAHRHDFSHVLGRTLEAWDGGWPALRAQIEAFARTRHATQNFATAGFVLCSVASALALVLSSQDSAEETLVRAVNLGGDADTVGAMVGGLIGAAAGARAFPPRWCVFPGSAAIRAFGRALAGEANAREELPDRLALEIELTTRWERERAR